ncbi:sodium:proton antiporter [Phycicoccus sp. MAQZ13P-2]|uniref:DUF6328 family protein n=1 Tax=Phycicoccus mangrovi TaxID=2840470 RepID=UPI001BFFDEFA|nr:DUF6328 family protein [Phycicoccus mangrovi]MBT9254622.1 sodium:proton antiporter [Phycicoccus mangrovi]MBT9273173.1 sodium:proton antiporter [Phycicoccus mangrovi]
MADNNSTQPSGRTLRRNWDELLQEIRVTQTGVQILTGFLLTVPFSARFGDLTTAQKGLYLAVLGGAVLTTGLVVAPVAFHRLLFRRRRRELLVDAGNRLAIWGLAMLSVTVAGVVTLVVDVVIGAWESVVAGGFALLVLALLWGVCPDWPTGSTTPHITPRPMRDVLDAGELPQFVVTSEPVCRDPSWACSWDRRSL